MARATPMTDPTAALAELAEKGIDIDVLSHRVQFMAHRLMELRQLAPTVD